MKPADQIPYYAPDGSSMGFRTLNAAKRLIAGGHVKPSYGRKKHLKAIWLLQKDGGNPVETHPRVGTRYSFREALDSGLHCWKLRRVDGRDNDGTPVNTRGVFLQVLKDCLVAWRIDGRSVRGISPGCGARFVAATARPKRRVAQPANPVPNGATRATRARTGADGAKRALPGRILGPPWRLSAAG